MKLLSAIQWSLPFCTLALSAPPPVSHTHGLFNIPAFNLTLPRIHFNLSVPGIPDPFPFHIEGEDMTVTFRNYGREFPNDRWLLSTGGALAYTSFLTAAQLNTLMGTAERVYPDGERGSPRVFLSVQPNERMTWYMWRYTLLGIELCVGSVMHGRGYETSFDIEVDGIGEVGSGNLTMTW